MPVDGIDGKHFLGVYRFPGPNQSKGNDASQRLKSEATANEQVNSRNQQFQEIRKMVDALPDVRLEKVNQLAKAIDDGSYDVSGKQIADAVIRKHLVDLNA
jgi:flagellar biosynthesis anti-sigma factor FlgM